MKKKSRRHQFPTTSGMKQDVTMDPADPRRILATQQANLHAHTWHLRWSGLNSHKTQPTIIHQIRNNFNICIAERNWIFFTPQGSNPLSLDVFTGECYQTFKDEFTPILHNLPENKRGNTSQLSLLRSYYPDT